MEDDSATDGEKLTSNSRRPASSSDLFSKGEKVLALHGRRIYEAEVQKAEIREDEWNYFVQFFGWNNVWEEWVGVDRLMKYTEENRSTNQIEGSERTIVKLQTLALTEYYKFKMLPTESLSSAFNRFSFIVNKLNRLGQKKINLENNVMFLRSLSDNWEKFKMMFQSWSNLSDYTLPELYGRIQSFESKVVEMCQKSRCPLPASTFHYQGMNEEDEFDEYTPQRFTSEYSAYELKQGHAIKKKNGKKGKKEVKVKDVAYYLQKIKLVQEREKATLMEFWSSGDEEDDGDEKAHFNKKR